MIFITTSQIYVNAMRFQVDTDTELIALLAKLRKLQMALAETEQKQALIKEELAATQTRANELRRKAEHRAQSENTAIGSQADADPRR